MSDLEKKIKQEIFQTLGKYDEKLFATAIELSHDFEVKNQNDLGFLIYSAAYKNSGFKKSAYPLGDGSIENVEREFNIHKWAAVLHRIYDSISTDDMSFEQALDVYSKSISDKNNERERFRQWAKYYKNGEHEKYSEEIPGVSKFAFQSGTLTDFYSNNFSPKPPEEDMATIEEEKQNFNSVKQKEEMYRMWREKLNSAVRRVDKLLRSGDDYLDPDTAVELAELLHSFDKESRKIRHKVTASDLAEVLATKFHKKGFYNGSNIMYKVAQELIPEETPTNPDVENPEPVQPTGVQNSLRKTPDESDKRSPISDALRDSSTAAPGEYEQLAGDVSIDLAAGKLEDIAARLSDRRSIRLLAELDIMLDKLGIAPMFPELAEAQSKLIDAYTYSLVRVTKMLGMLSSGKNLAEIANAKSREIEHKTMKEVNKTFNGPDESELEPQQGKGTQQIEQELGKPNSLPAQEPVKQAPQE